MVKGVRSAQLILFILGDFHKVLCKEGAEVSTRRGTDVNRL